MNHQRTMLAISPAIQLICLSDRNLYIDAVHASVSKCSHGIKYYLPSPSIKSPSKSVFTPTVSLALSRKLLFVSKTRIRNMQQLVIIFVHLQNLKRMNKFSRMLAVKKKYIVQKSIPLSSLACRWFRNLYSILYSSRHIFKTKTSTGRVRSGHSAPLWYPRSWVRTRTFPQSMLHASSRLLNEAKSV
jgi:hypothetical protein